MAGFLGNQVNLEGTFYDFWQREIDKCNYVKERRVIRKEEF